MSLLKALKSRNECDGCSSSHGVEKVWFDGEFVGQYCKDCRLFGAHLD